MKPSVLFIYSPFAGQLNKTTLLAKHYEKHGYSVQYLIHDNSDWFKNSVPYQIISTNAFPIGVKFKRRKSIKDDNRNSRPIRDAVFQRKKALQDAITEVKPTIIFLDEYCATDYGLFYKFITSIRCVILVSTLPNFTDWHIPPLNSFRSPNVFARLEWITSNLKYWYSEWRNYFFLPIASIKRCTKIASGDYKIPKFRFFGN